MNKGWQDGWFQRPTVASDVTVNPADAADSFSRAPTQSTQVQAAIDTTFLAGGGVVRLPPGVFYGSFKMRPDVDVIGSGWQTTLRAMPGQTAPVVDYSIYNAYHTVLRDLRVDGNYIYGRTDGVTQGNCNGILMDTLPGTPANWIFNNRTYTPFIIPDGAIFPGLPNEWNDCANSIERVLVTSCGGLYGIYIGGNQRGAWLDRVFVYACYDVAIANHATDTQATNVQAGACGDGITVNGQNQQWTNCKSWYHGINAGFTGTGDGWRVNLPDATTYGAIRFIGCESQDNARYGFAVLNGTGVIQRGCVSGGDTGAALYLNNAQNCDFDFSIQFADRTQNTVGVLLDANGTAPAGNRVRWTGNLANVVTSGFTPYSYANGANGYGNDLQGPPSLQHGLALLTLSTTYTPTTAKSYMAGAFTGNISIANPVIEGGAAIQPGEELTIVLYDSTGGHTVSWGSAYFGPASFTTTAGKVSVFTFIYIGSGDFILQSSSPNA